MGKDKLHQSLPLYTNIGTGIASKRRNPSFYTTKALFSFTAYKRPDFPVNAKQNVGAKIHA